MHRAVVIGPVDRVDTPFMRRLAAHGCASSWCRRGLTAVVVPSGRNGANAPADSPEHESAAGEAASDAETSAEAGASAPGEGSRGTPGMSQPGSVIDAASRQDNSLTSTAHTFDYSRFDCYFSNHYCSAQRHFWSGQTRIFA
jgi:hypothetical protein